MNSPCRRFGIFVCVASAGIVLNVSADMLELRNGTVLTGKYAGGTAGTIRFETVNGLKTVAADQARTLTFSVGAEGASPPSAPTPPAKSAASSPSEPGVVSVPVGTVFLVRMLDGETAGRPYGAGVAAVLEADLEANGVTIARAGTVIHGRRVASGVHPGKPGVVQPGLLLEFELQQPVAIPVVPAKSNRVDRL
jgi:hypothetical protein